MGVAKISAVTVTPGDQEDSNEGVRLVNVKFKEAKIAEKLADTSVSFGSCFDMVEKGTMGHQQGWVWHIRLWLMRWDQLRNIQTRPKGVGSVELNNQVIESCFVENVRD
jgi:hypothetical protein